MSTEKIIKYKTEAWKNTQLAENHLKVSGVRGEGLFMPILERIADELPKEGKILDVGCGHGRLSIALAERGFNIVASDVSEEMLKLLTENKGANNIEVRKADAHNLSAENDEFDAIVSYDFMPHFPNWDVLLAEQTRVCKRGGKIIFGMNFLDHRIFAENNQSGTYIHHYTPDPKCNTKEFWAETTHKNIKKLSKKLSLNVLKIIPIKFLNENFIFGKALGNNQYDEIKKQINEKINEDIKVEKFYRWLEINLFQQINSLFSYHSLIVLEKR